MNDPASTTDAAAQTAEPTPRHEAAPEGAASQPADSGQASQGVNSKRASGIGAFLDEINSLAKAEIDRLRMPQPYLVLAGPEEGADLQRYFVHAKSARHAVAKVRDRVLETLRREGEELHIQAVRLPVDHYELA
jgi:hypothetical protein